MRKRIIMAAMAICAILAVAACGTQAGNKGARLELKQQQQNTLSLELAQPVPHYNYSQIRQNLIELETAQANGVQTTSFFFNQGVRDPVQTCPSIGSPIPTTDQLSNPLQEQKDNVSPVNNGGGNVTLGQMDPDGVYSGDSSGTYVLCIGADGKPYADYWEGFVQTVFGPATWNATAHQVQLTGPPSFSFTKHQ